MKNEERDETLVVAEGIYKSTGNLIDALSTVWATAESIFESTPIDMILPCPSCGTLHVDKPEPDVCEKCGHDKATHTEDGDPGPERCHFSFCDCSQYREWTNPSHKSHLCHGCGLIWRPADVPTNGVAQTKTQGSRDTWKGGKA